MSGPQNSTKNYQKNYGREDKIVITDNQDEFVGVEKNYEQS